MECPCCSASEKPTRTVQFKVMLFLGLAVMVVNAQVSVAEIYDDQYYCPDYHPQKTLDVERVMGLWYIREIIQHKREENMVHGSIFLRTCPTVHLALESKSDIRLVWNEHMLTVYYKMRLSDPTSPGFWLASGPHNETSIEHYNPHFTGTIQVMKAVGTHMALTFCTRTTTDSQLFSVLLDRDRRLSKLEVRSVNTMLQRRGLQPLFIKHACSGAAKLFRQLFYHFVLLVAWKCFL